MIGRRGFLKLLGFAAAAPLIAKVIPPALVTEEAAPVATTVTTFLCGKEAIVATVGQYADYVSFSDLTLAATLDPAMQGLQKELAYRIAYAVDSASQYVV